MKKALTINFRKLKNKKGFTLIETLLYIAIIGVTMIGFVSFSLSVSGSKNKTYMVQEVQANTRTALNIVSQKIRHANGINIPDSIFDLSPGFLSLSSASSTLNPTIIALNQDTNRLEIKEGMLATTSLTSDEVRVTNLIFTNLTGSSTYENIRINLTVEYDNTSSDVKVEQNAQTAVRVRQ